MLRYRGRAPLPASRLAVSIALLGILVLVLVWGLSCTSCWKLLWSAALRGVLEAVSPWRQKTSAQMFCTTRSACRDGDDRLLPNGPLTRLHSAHTTSQGLRC
jgi:hypothetical protein